MPSSRLGIVPLAAALLALAGDAQADPSKEECVAANVSAQGLSRDGKLRLAREQLRVCASPACPAIVRDDCTQRLDELERIQPTIVFSVKDAAGNDVSAVAITIDGAPLAETPGTPVPVEPGSHVFTFNVGGVSVNRTLVIVEGEKARREQVALAASAAPGPAADPDPGSTRRVAGLVVGGAGLAGLVVGGVFGGLVLSEASTQKSDCSGASSAAATCKSYAAAAAAHSSGVTDGTVSTVGFIAGGALLVGGVVLFVTGRAPTATKTGALTLTPSLGPGAGGLVWSGAF